MRSVNKSLRLRLRIEKEKRNGLTYDPTFKTLAIIATGIDNSLNSQIFEKRNGLLDPTFKNLAITTSTIISSQLSAQLSAQSSVYGANQTPLKTQASTLDHLVRAVPTLGAGDLR